MQGPSRKIDKYREILARDVVRKRWLSERSSMRTLLSVCFSISLLSILGGCKERKSTMLTRDACSLISKEEVESVQEAPMNETKSNERSDGVFRVSQCFYTATEFSKSVNLALIQKDPDHRASRSPKEFWKKKFGRYSGDEKERAKVEKETEHKEEKEESVPPKKIDGIGDEAFWASNRFGGILYVLKGDAFISVSLGGTDAGATKLEKSKALAQKALRRF